MKKLVTILTAVASSCIVFQVASIIFSFWGVPGSTNMAGVGLLAAVPLAVISIGIVIVLFTKRDLFNDPWHEILQMFWMTNVIIQIILIMLLLAFSAFLVNLRM